MSPPLLASEQRCRPRPRFTHPEDGSSLSTSTGARALELVDLGSYPIDRPEREEYAALAARCRGQLTTTGASIVRGFLRPAALHRALESTEALIPGAHHSEIDNGSPYLELPDDHWPEGHPRLMHSPTSLFATPYDRFPPRARSAASTSPTRSRPSSPLRSTARTCAATTIRSPR